MFKLKYLWCCKSINYMQRINNLAHSAILLAIVALVYFTYSYIAANGSSNLTLTADSVALNW